MKGLGLSCGVENPLMPPPPHPQIGALAAKTLALFVRLESARYLLPVKEIVLFRNVGAHAHVGVGVLMGV